MARIGEWLRGLLPASVQRLPYAQPSAPQPRSPVLTPYAEGNNAFGIALYETLAKKPGNLFLSPFSIRTALAMTYAGAKDTTAAEMAAVLHFPPSDEELHASFARIIALLNAAGGGMYEMAVANSLWAQEGSAMLAAYGELAARYYGGALYGVDFERAFEEARARINQWVEEKTRERIRDLIPVGGVSTLTRLVLVNAVYFKGKWSEPFLEELTRDEPFYLEGGGKVRASLMLQHDRIRYMEGRYYQAVDLPYQGDDLSMVILLPGKRNGLRRLERMLSSELIEDALARMESCPVKLFLPRFKVVWGTEEISDVLKALGMPAPFTGGVADFSGINGFAPPDDRSLYVTAVFHKAFVETNELGTEAAAATAVVDTVRSMPFRPRPQPIPVFRADHPFLFAIRERSSHAVLFLGRVADPTRES